MRSNRRRSRWLSPTRLLLIMLAVQLLCLLLWGLTWPGRSQVELSFVVPQDEVVPWQGVIADFEVSHPNIRLHLVTDPETTYTTDQRRAIYSADAQATVAQYDLVYLDVIWSAQFVDELVDLKPLIQRDGIDTSEFLASELTVGRAGERLYRLPMRADLGVLYYRKDLLTEAGLPLPQSLAELNQTVETLRQTSEAKLGYVWQGRSYEGLVANFVEIMHSYGATWIDADTLQVGLDRAAALQAAELLRQFLQLGISPEIVTDYTENLSLQAFEEERAAFLRGWPYFWSELRQKGWEDKVGVALPFSFTAEPGVGCRGGWGFGIPQNAAHPDEAWEAIKYLTSEVAQKKFVLASGFLPSRRSLFQDPDIVLKYPLMPQLFQYLEHSSLFRPAIRQYREASEILQTALGKILRNQQSVRLAMDQAQRETEALLEQE